MTARRWIVNHPLTTLAVAASALVAVACSDNTGNPPTQPEATSTSKVYTAEQFEATAKPRFTTDGGATPFRTSKTIPYWSSTFTDPTNGVTYPYTMVGTNAFSSTSTSTIPTVIIPFRFVFASAPANGSVMDGAQDVAATIASPIFTNYTYPLSGGDVAQYGDAIQRAQFNRIGSTYHVNLGGPTVLPTQNIDVPANQGFTFRNSRGDLVGLMDIAWFSNRLHQAINDLHVPATALPLILVHNTFMYAVDPSVYCCVIGYHGATASRNGNGDQQVQTYMFGAFVTPRTFGGWPGVGLSDIHGISHEVSEWMDDPFVNNAVNPWLTPTAPQYGCTGLMETGDPVVGYWFPLPGNPQANANGVWHPEDEVYFSWFARQTPSIAYNGLYTYMGTFTSPATGC